MSREIYQDIILGHFREPACRAEVVEGDANVFQIRNPNCGDLILLQVVVDDGSVSLCHQAQGCAASVASCSIMCETLSGKNVHEVDSEIVRFFELLNSPEGIEGLDSIELEALLFFKNVPARKLCVSLAWTCLQNALATMCKEG